MARLIMFSVGFLVYTFITATLETQYSYNYVSQDYYDSRMK